MILYTSPTFTIENRRRKGAEEETKEELSALKEEVESLNAKLAELSEDELNQVAGGDKSDPVYWAAVKTLVPVTSEDIHLTP